MRSELLAEIIRRYEAGENGIDLAEEAGISRNYLYQLLKKAGVVIRPIGESNLASVKLGHRIEMVCDNCDRTFSEYPTKRPRPLKFCNRACGLEFQKRGNRGRGMEQIDIETAVHPKPAKPGETVVVDFANKELRNV